MLGFSGTRRWIYPLRVTGRFQQWHRQIGRVLLAFLIIVPWIPIGGHPAARIDLPARRVYAFGSTFTASDGFLLVLIGLFAAFSLFFFTSLYGRLWCGFACPQTVFLEEFVRPIERAIEGDRGTRMRRDKGRWTADFVLRRAAKWAAFLLVGFLASMSFMGWFSGAPALWTGHAGPVDYAFVAAFTGGWFLDFAWFREQFCNYLCPYARFQGALTDEQTLVVAYDEVRGEPRAATKEAAAKGACVDCDKCVVVCPQGIDIRNGFQLECISCARCVDACEGVMGNLGHPTLVRFATLAEAQPAPQAPPKRRIRPRVVAYGGLLTAIAAGILFLIATHQPLQATVQRTPGSLYTVDADGWIRNTFLVSVSSLEDADTRFDIAVEGMDAAEVIAPELVLAPGESRTVPLIVRLRPSDDLPRTIPFQVRLRTVDGEVLRDATFKTPGAS